MLRLVALMLAVLLPALGSAQAPGCAIPTSALPARHAELPSEREPVRDLPVASYTLAVSWAPQYCRTHKDGFECGGANRFGWTLHGLWPDGAGRDWPQYCRAVDLLPDMVVRPMLCATPSPQLVQHEWAKHGSCMAGVTPERYLALERGLFAKLRFPDMKPLSYRSGLDAIGFSRAFAAVNPGMRGNMLRLDVDRQGWLQEAWLCFDTAFRLRACPAGAGGAPATRTLRIWRGDGPSGTRADPARRWRDGIGRDDGG